MDSRARRNKEKSICENCGLNTNSAAILKKHMKNCNQDNKRITKSKRIQCKQCDKKFNKEQTFKNHMKSEVSRK